MAADIGNIIYRKGFTFNAQDVGANSIATSLSENEKVYPQIIQEMSPGK